MSLCTTAGAGALLYTKPASNRNLLSILPLQLNLPYFIEEFQSVDLHLLSRPHTFWNYFWTHNQACLEILSIPLQILSSNSCLWMWIIHTNSAIQRAPQIIIAQVKIWSYRMTQSTIYLVFPWKTQTLLFWKHSLHTRLQLQGHMKRPNEELHGDFQNACICYCGQVHSHLKSTIPHLRTTIRVPSQEIHWLQILAVLASCYPA